MTDRSQRGRRAREYGHDFERLIARKLREAFPDAEVKRTLQSHRAYESDVTVIGAPQRVCDIWWECHTGNSNPLAKLEQAERDVRCARKMRYPMAVWRKKGLRAINATMRLSTLRDLTHLRGDSDLHRCVAVTLEFDSLLVLLKVDMSDNVGDGGL